MSQDYEYLYGGTKSPTPPEEPPKPFKMDSREVQLHPIATQKPAEPAPFPEAGGQAPPNSQAVSASGARPQPNMQTSPTFSSGMQPNMQAAPTFSSGTSSAPRPYAMESSEVFTPPRPASKPKQPFSPIPLLLVAGVVFLFLGGVLVLTKTWDALPDAARAASLLSVGIISFGVNLLAEKVLRLPKTAIAFYILGCIFLPMAVAGIGAFSLFGEWFSFTGNGAPLVWAACSGCVAASAMVGAFGYRNPFLAWLSLAGIGATYFCIDDYIAKASGLDAPVQTLLFGALLILFCGGATVWSEWKLRRNADTPYSKAALWFLCPALLLTMLWLIVAAIQGKSHLATSVLPVFLIVLSLNRRFARSGIHFGICIIVPALLTIFGTISRFSPFVELGGYPQFLFAVGASVLVLLACHVLPDAFRELRLLTQASGYILGVLVLLAGILPAYLAEGTHLFVVLSIMLGLGAVLLLANGKHKYAKDTPVFVMETMILFLTAVLGNNPEKRPLYLLMLVTGALLLLVQGALCRRIWCFVLAGAAAGGMVLLHLENPFLWLLCLGTGISFGSVIYAHLAGRTMLEKASAWVTVGMLVTAVMELAGKAHLNLPYGMICLLPLTLIALLYLLEAVAFAGHGRTQGIGTKLYLEISAMGMACAAFSVYLWDEHFERERLDIGWGILLAMLLLLFAVVFTRKKINLGAVPFLALLFFTLHHLIGKITAMQMTGWGFNDPELMKDLLHVGCYVLILALFAGMGRVLLPKFIETDSGLRVDLPLLSGVLPIIAAVFTIDWYPMLLLSLFMTLYSLLFLGRLKNRRIPAFLASLFGCMTIFLHNHYDPFQLLDKLNLLDIQTLQILLYLLPVHLFLFTLLWILPKTARPGVHIARFVMYCVTMLCLLVASLRFGNVADALILTGFSFAVLVGSFVVRRLRWFTLGFAVLVTETIRLTWAFWTSLHWGIYLFLAGIILIVIASLYEYSARYAREHPDAPKKKFRLFAAWKW